MPPPADPDAYHITDVSNLAAIIATGGLFSDAFMAANAIESTVVGYSHIKQRRLTECRVDCLPNGPFVGEFVPFYYCPRSVMLFTINRGNTGRPVGCQATILHLVAQTSALMGLGREWAISDGNASAAAALFYNQSSDFAQLDWAAIKATSWKGLSHQKAAEFLVRERVPWEIFYGIGCQNQAVATQVQAIIEAGPSAHRPQIKVLPGWYY